MTTHWPAVGSQWKRVIDHGVQDKTRVDYPEPHAVEYLIVDKVDPGEHLGRQIQGRITRQPIISGSHIPPIPYSTSQIIFWELWQPIGLGIDHVDSFGGEFKREENSDGES